MRSSCKSLSPQYCRGDQKRVERAGHTSWLIPKEPSTALKLPWCSLLAVAPSPCLRHPPRAPRLPPPRTWRLSGYRIGQPTMTGARGGGVRLLQAKSPCNRRGKCTPRAPACPADANRCNTHLHVNNLPHISGPFTCRERGTMATALNDAAAGPGVGALAPDQHGIPLSDATQSVASNFSGGRWVRGRL